MSDVKFDPYVRMSDFGKMIVVPMNHKKRVELMNFLSFLYLDKKIEKGVMRELLNGCYAIVISDLSKNGTRRYFDNR